MTWTRARGAAAPLGLLLAACALTGCGSTPPEASLASVPIAAVSAPATARSTMALATLPIGILTSKDDTFWQLFVRSGGQWRLTTPPDVATNGGVVAAPGASGAITAAVLPSNELRFSPLVRSADAGRTWSTAVAPAALVVAPDALAVTSDTTLAVLASPRGAIAAGDAGLERWTTVPSPTSALVSAGCSSPQVAAVATTSRGLVVGGACTTSGRAPIAILRQGRWHVVGPIVGVAKVAVLRLEATPRGVVALLELARGATRSLVAATSDAGLVRWTVSDPLVVTADRLVSTSTVASSVSVVLQLPSGARVARSATGPGAWSGAVMLPAKTFDVVPGRGGLQALAGTGAALTVYLRTGATWRVAQRVVVPITLGSSS